jgi:hypothetical protein
MNKYAVYKGNFRLDKKSQKVAEFQTITEALNAMAELRNKSNSKDYYVVDPNTA